MRILHVSALPVWPMGNKGGMPSLHETLKGHARAGHELCLVLPGAGRWARVCSSGLGYASPLGTHPERDGDSHSPWYMKRGRVTTTAESALQRGQDIIATGSLDTTGAAYVRREFDACRQARHLCRLYAALA